ncbi:MAG: endolytic transglycosylase MltG [Kangiellaceae bacterium]
MSVLKDKKLILRYVFGVSLLFFFLTVYWFWLEYRSFQKTELSFPNQENKFDLKAGWGVGHLAHHLESEGKIDSSLYFKLLAKQYPEYTKFKAGEYLIPNKLKPMELLKILTDGEVIQYPFQIIEGQNKWEILGNLINQKGNLRLGLQGNNNDKARLEKYLIDELDIKSDTIEGWLFPDTYNYSKGDSALSLVARSVRDMKNALEQEWENREDGLPLKTPYEALILASIIEKETGVVAERERIAGVFIRRLQKGMKLQTDPTVIYGIGEHFNGDITWKDLKTKTPYNTRIIKGLPPTPIASPSRASIHAALHPAKEEALYFVADGSGGHHFSNTLREHNNAVKRWLKKEKSN